MDNSFTGVWIRIDDEKSAHYAVRMASLPLFLFGANLFISGISLLGNLLALTPEIERVELIPLTMTLLGIPLMIFAFYLRKSRGLRFLPFVNGAMLVLIILQILYSPWISIFVNIMALGLSVSGIRGWHWLRTNNKPVA